MRTKASHMPKANQLHTNGFHAKPIHQPGPPEKHPMPESEELSAAFKSTIAVILAFDEETTPLTVNFDDPSKRPVICHGPDGGEIARPLQVYEGKPLIEHALTLAQSCNFNAV